MDIFKGQGKILTNNQEIQKELERMGISFSPNIINRSVNFLIEKDYVQRIPYMKTIITDEEKVNELLCQINSKLKLNDDLWEELKEYVISLESLLKVKNGVDILKRQGKFFTTTEEIRKELEKMGISLNNHLINEVVNFLIEKDYVQRMPSTQTIVTDKEKVNELLCQINSKLKLNDDLWEELKEYRIILENLLNVKNGVDILKRQGKIFTNNKEIRKELARMGMSFGESSIQDLVNFLVEKNYVKRIPDTNTIIIDEEKVNNILAPFRFNAGLKKKFDKILLEKLCAVKQAMDSLEDFTVKDLYTKLNEGRCKIGINIIYSSLRTFKELGYIRSFPGVDRKVKIYRKVPKNQYNKKLLDSLNFLNNVTE